MIFNSAEYDEAQLNAVKALNGPSNSTTQPYSASYTSGTFLGGQPYISPTVYNNTGYHTTAIQAYFGVETSQDSQQIDHDVKFVYDTHQTGAGTTVKPYSANYINNLNLDGSETLTDYSTSTTQAYSASYSNPLAIHSTSQYHPYSAYYCNPSVIYDDDPTYSTQHWYSSKYINDEFANAAKNVYEIYFTVSSNSDSPIAVGNMPTDVPHWMKTNYNGFEPSVTNPGPDPNPDPDQQLRIGTGSLTSFSTQPGDVHSTIFWAASYWLDGAFKIVIQTRSEDDTTIQGKVTFFNTSPVNIPTWQTY